MLPLLGGRLVKGDGPISVGASLGRRDSEIDAALAVLPPRSRRPPTLMLQWNAEIHSLSTDLTNGRYQFAITYTGRDVDRGIARITSAANRLQKPPNRMNRAARTCGAD